MFWNKILKYYCHYLCLESDRDYRVYHLDKIYQTEIESAHKMNESILIFFTDGIIASFRPLVIKREQIKIRLQFELITLHVLEADAIIKKYK